MLIDNHISITSAYDMRVICQPLFENSKITYFEFRRLFPDGSCVWLSTNGGFVKKISGVEVSQADILRFKTTMQPGNRYHLLNTLNGPQSQRKSLIAREFNFGHGLLVTEKCNSYLDFFSFASQWENSEINNFYFNNMNFIDKFIFYFKDKASLLIKQATMQKIYFPGVELLQDKSMLSITSPQILGGSLKVNNYIFSLEDKKISLSNQELNSVRLLAKGYTIKRAAQYLNISPRTVEYYLKSAREKLNIKTNEQLILMYWNSTLARIG